MPDTTNELDEILRMEEPGDVVNSVFEVHTLSQDEPDIECIHIEQWAIDRAKKQLQALITKEKNKLLNELLKENIDPFQGYIDDIRVVPVESIKRRIEE